MHNLEAMEVVADLLSHWERSDQSQAIATSPAIPVVCQVCEYLRLAISQAHYVKQGLHGSACKTDEKTR